MHIKVRAMGIIEYLFVLALILDCRSVYISIPSLS